MNIWDIIIYAILGIGAIITFYVIAHIVLSR